MDPIHVAVVEDDTSTREGLSFLVGGTPGYRCSGAYGSVEEAVPQLAAQTPDVLLLDIDLPGMSGSEAAGILHARFPAMQILMLTVYAERERVFESICNGASGYLLKQTPPARLLEAIREAHQGGSPMSPEIARQVVLYFRKPPRARSDVDQLTPHETRLLGLLAEGYSYQAVGERLSISVNTVRTYIRVIYEKLHVHSKSEAVSKAFREGLIR